MMAADHEQQRLLEPGQGARAGRAGERPAETRAAAPQDRLLERSPGLDQCREVSFARGIAEEGAAARERLWRGGEPEGRATPAKLVREIAGDRLPGQSGRRAPVLASLRGDPLLGRKGRRDHSARKAAARQSGRDLAGGIAAQQRIDFLDREIGARKRVEPRRCRQVALPRFGVEGEAAGGPAAQTLVPKDRQRAGERDQRGRRIERAGQVVGDDSNPHQPRPAVQRLLIVGGEIDRL